jgi:hypothetical protein
MKSVKNHYLLHHVLTTTDEPKHTPKFEMAIDFKYTHKF